MDISTYSKTQTAMMKKLFNLLIGRTKWSNPKPWGAEISKSQARSARMEWALSHVAHFGAEPVLLVECGVAAGSSLAHMLAFTKSQGLRFKIVGFDSFEGFPDATPSDSAEFDPNAAEFRVYRQFSENLVRQNISSVHGLSEDDVLDLELVKGWIPNSFSGFDFSRGIALLHIDVDLYAPYKASLEALWDFVLPGGLVIFDEYDVGRDTEKWPGAKKAIDEFTSQKGIRIYKHWTGRAHIVKH